MNPYQYGAAANWQYGYTLGPGSDATGGAYAAYYAGAPAAGTGMSQHHAYRPPPQHRTITTIQPTATSNNVKATSWQQIKEQQHAATGTPQAAPSSKPYYPTKMFVKASSTPAVGGAAGAAAAAVVAAPSPAANTAADDSTVCMRLHEVAIQNKIVETYEKVTTEVAPGIHGVRLKLGTEVFTGTGPNFKAAKQNAAATALAQTKYPKPVEKKTMKMRPHGITATQELHELATKKGTEAKFRFIEPANFEFKAAMGLWSKEEMRGNYRVQLVVNGFEYYGQADLPQQAKHNAAIQALPMLNRLQDAASASKVNVVIPASGTSANGSTSNAAGNEASVKNVIMILNEIAMAQNQCMEWSMVREDGPPHARKFTWSLKMGTYETLGVGCSKKVAKSLAAQSMFEKIPAEWKNPANDNNAAKDGKVKKRKPKPKKRKAGEEGAEGTIEGISAAKKVKAEGGDDSATTATAADGPARPAYSVIHATNPISALYEYCRKIKAPDPDFECIAENVLETWQKDNHTFKKTEYTMKLQVSGKQFFASANTKKAAKTAVATEAWNVLRIENI